MIEFSFYGRSSEEQLNAPFASSSIQKGKGGKKVGVAAGSVTPGLIEKDGDGKK